MQTKSATKGDVCNALHQVLHQKKSGMEKMKLSSSKDMEELSKRLLSIASGFPDQSFHVKLLIKKNKQVFVSAVIGLYELPDDEEEEPSKTIPLGDMKGKKEFKGWSEVNYFG